MPICHCGGSGVLQGLLRRFYKFVITKPKAEAIQKKDRQSKLSHCEGGKILKQVQDDMRRHCEELATKQSPRLKRILLDCFVVSDYSDCRRSNVRLQLTGWGTSCHGALPKIRARNDGKYLLSTPLPKNRTQNEKKKAAFTLAEVLITLGIIGVVAAMTMPMLIAKYQKLVVETKLQVFYAQINDAFRRAHADYDGTFDDWIVKDKTYSYDENKTFLETYLLPYVKYTKVEKYIAKSSGQTYACVSMVNGTIICLSIDGNGGDIMFYPNGNLNVKVKTREWFGFQMVKKKIQGSKKYNSIEFIEPYVLDWNGNRESLKTGTWGCYKGCENCSYCTKLIQINGWKIPDDYPW